MGTPSITTRRIVRTLLASTALVLSACGFFSKPEQSGGSQSGGFIQNTRDTWNTEVRGYPPNWQKDLELSNRRRPSQNPGSNVGMQANPYMMQDPNAGYGAPQMGGMPPQGMGYSDMSDPSMGGGMPPDAMGYGAMQDPSMDGGMPPMPPQVNAQYGAVPPPNYDGRRLHQQGGYNDPFAPTQPMDTYPTDKMGFGGSFPPYMPGVPQIDTSVTPTPDYGTPMPNSEMGYTPPGPKGEFDMPPAYMRSPVYPSGVGQNGVAPTETYAPNSPTSPTKGPVTAAQLKKRSMGQDPYGDGGGSEPESNYPSLQPQPTNGYGNAYPVPASGGYNPSGYPSGATGTYDPYANPYPRPQHHEITAEFKPQAASFTMDGGYTEPGDEAIRSRFQPMDLEASMHRDIEEPQAVEIFAPDEYSHPEEKAVVKPAKKPMNRSRSNSMFPVEKYAPKNSRQVNDLSSSDRQINYLPETLPGEGEPNKASTDIDRILKDMEAKQPKQQDADSAALSAGENIDADAIAVSGENTTPVSGIENIKSIELPAHLPRGKNAKGGLDNYILKDEATLPPIETMSPQRIKEALDRAKAMSGEPVAGDKLPIELPPLPVDQIAELPQETPVAEEVPVAEAAPIGISPSEQSLLDRAERRVASPISPVVEAPVAVVSRPVEPIAPIAPVAPVVVVAEEEWPAVVAPSYAPLTPAVEAPRDVMAEIHKTEHTTKSLLANHDTIVRNPAPAALPEPVVATPVMEEPEALPEPERMAEAPVETAPIAAPAEEVTENSFIASQPEVMQVEAPQVAEAADALPPPPVVVIEQAPPARVSGYVQKNNSVYKGSLPNSRYAGRRR